MVSTRSETSQQSPPTAPKARSSFKLFPKLPIEIRLMIWEAAFEPRIVHLKEYYLPQCHHQLRCVRSDTIVADQCVEDTQAGGTYCDPKYDIRYPSNPDHERIDFQVDDGQFVNIPYIFPWLGLKSDTPVPALLHVWSGISWDSLEVLQFGFAALGSKPQVDFNFELDTLYLDKKSFS